MTILTDAAPVTHFPWCDRALHSARNTADRDAYGDAADDDPGCASTVITAMIGDTPVAGFTYRVDGRTAIALEVARRDVTLTPGEADAFAAWLAGLTAQARQVPQ
jgi:hypothetical protein